VEAKDFTRGRTGVPMRFEIEVELEAKIYGYVIAFYFSEEFKELRVLEEKLAVDGKPVYTREVARVHLEKSRDRKQAKFPIDAGLVALPIEGQFPIDSQLVALPIVQQQSPKDPLSVFKQWLARMIILRPMPSLIKGDSEKVTLEPRPSVTNIGAWFSGLLAHAPSAYTKVDEYLKQVMPDMKDIKNPLVGRDARSLFVQFSNDQGSVTLPFEDLSDGEKCFMICALVLAANDAYGPLLCFWDEPDNHLALSEVGHFVLALRKAFQSGGQFIATSHNPEAIRSFSDENTLLLYRKSHLEPTIVRPLEELQVSGDLVDALIRGDVEP
jgi:hypothetical protein